MTDTTKKAVNYLYLNHNKLNDLSSFKDYVNVSEIFVPWSGLTSLKGVEKMTGLKYLYAYNNNLDSITGEENEDTDALSELAGHADLYYLDLADNSKLNKVSYLSDCTNLKYLFLKNCPSIEDYDIVSLKSIFKNCIEYSYDSKYSLALVDEDEERLDLKNQIIKKSVFEGFKDCKNLKFLDLGGAKIQEDSSTNNLSIEDINELFNRVIPNFTNLEQLSLNGLSNLNDGRFLKKLTKLQRLDVRGAGIITGSKSQDGEDLGLENINNITTLVQLGVDNPSIDLTKIQSSISRLGGGNHLPTDIFHQHSSGLICDNGTVLKTLENCSLITRLLINRTGVGIDTLSSIDLDLSNCSSLTYFNFRWFKIKSVKLPSNLTNCAASWDYDMTITFDTESLISVIDLDGMSEACLTSIFNSLENNSTLTSLSVRRCNIPSNISKFSNCTNLNSLSLGGDTGSMWNAAGIDNISLLSSSTSLKNFTICYTDYDNLNFLENFTSITKLSVYGTNISDISGISNLTGLTTIEMYNNKFSDISALENMTNCTSLNLSGNKISNVYPLRNLTLLKTLNLENNAIYDFADGRSNLEILANLNPSNGGQLTKLLLAGNSITDFGKVSSLTWKDGRSGF